MPKSRKNKYVRNKSKARKRRTEFELKQLVGRIDSQEMLDYCLLDVQDIWERRAMFDLIRPLLSFNAVFPSRMNMPALKAPSAERFLVHV